MSDDATGIPIGAIQEKLGYLKRNGCNLLVTGNVREEVSHRVTQKLLGAPDVPRSRILALTDHDREDAADLLPGEIEATDGGVQFVEYGCGTRTAAAAAPSKTDQTSFGTDAAFVGGDPDEFQRELCNAITTAKIAESGFDPAELRLSLFTLSYLANQHDPAAVDRFVSAVGDHVRGVRGMAHYHLPVADDSKPVRRLTPLFDARIELRETNGRPEQRWHFPDDDVTTVWVGL